MAHALVVATRAGPMDRFNLITLEHSAGRRSRGTPPTASYNRVQITPSASALQRFDLKKGTSDQAESMYGMWEVPLTSRARSRSLLTFSNSLPGHPAEATCATSRLRRAISPASISPRADRSAWATHLLILQSATVSW